MFEFLKLQRRRNKNDDDGGGESKKEAALRIFREYMGDEIADNARICEVHIHKDSCNLLWVYIPYIYNNRWSNYACYMDATTHAHVNSPYDHT